MPSQIESNLDGMREIGSLLNGNKNDIVYGVNGDKYITNVLQFACVRHSCAFPMCVKGAFGSFECVTDRAHDNQIQCFIANSFHTQKFLHRIYFSLLSMSAEKLIMRMRYRKVKMRIRKRTYEEKRRRRKRSCSEKGAKKQE